MEPRELWEHGAAGPWTKRDPSSPDDPQKRVRWVRAGGASSQEIAAIGARFKLHPLTLEDVQNERQRPKVEEYEDALFVVLRVPSYVEDTLRFRQAGIYLFADGVITISKEPLYELDSLEAELQQGLRTVAGKPDRLFHHILDALVDAWFPIVDYLEEYTEDLEDRCLERPTEAHFSEVQDTKQTLSRIRKVSLPMRDALGRLEREGIRGIDGETRLLMRDVVDHIQRIQERLEHVREITMTAQDGWHASLARKQNEESRRLTLVAGALLIPTLLAGLGGMNFDGFPGWDFWNVTVLILLIAVGGLLWAFRPRTT